MFEAVQFVEPELSPGVRYTGPIETVLGVFETEAEAIEIARKAWHHEREANPRAVAWWLVRQPGEQLARWIADSRHDQERVLDLTTNQLVEYKG